MQALGMNPGRGAVGAGVIALHLLALWAFIVAGRIQFRRGPAEPVMTWLSFPDAPPRPQITRPASLPAHRRQPAPIVAVSPDLPRPTAITPDTLPDRKPATDWNAAAVDAARHHLDRLADERQRDRSMGTAPDGSAPATAPHPAFPWGHQPMGKHFDIERGVLMVRTKRCVFGVFVILPGFSCNPGRIDPEPGQGDLFDPKYAPRPLELPQPLLDDPVHR